MAEMRPEEMITLNIAQIRAVLKGMGWEIVASDTRGDVISVTIQKAKPAIQTRQEEGRK